VEVEADSAGLLQAGTFFMLRHKAVNI
jgi:hypothetical protein